VSEQARSRPESRLLVLDFDAGTDWESYVLPKNVLETLEEIVAREPDQTFSDPVELEALQVLVIGERRYALEDDEIIFTEDGRSQIWRSEGIQSRIMSAVGRK